MGSLGEIEEVGVLLSSSSLTTPFSANPMPLLSLNHVSFVCKSVSRSVRFYEDVLGFVLIKRPSSFKFEGAWILVCPNVSVSSMSVLNMAMGCGHNNQGSFNVIAGLLGLGGGRMSFVNQIPEMGGAFRYCLPSYSSISPGWLTFGRDLGGAFPVGAAWASLAHNPRALKFYYVGLSGLGVGGVRVPISEDIFPLIESGYRGIIIDTGTAVTTLPIVAYEALRDAFTAKTRGVRAPSVSIFDTCYHQYSDNFQFPSISFYFLGGPILTLASHDFLIPVDGVGTICFAFAPSASGLSFIGNIQQAGIQISIDEARGYIGFGPNVC